MTQSPNALFKDIAQALKKIHFEESRKDTSDYLEFVIRSEKVEILCKTLEIFFGPPFKPAGKSPSKEAADYTNDFGGIQKNQVLYYFETDGLSYCAMLWPWLDGENVTVKVALGQIGSGARLV